MCEHEWRGNCLISSILASMEVPIDQKACEICKSTDQPMDLNNVTCSRAAMAMRESGLEPSSEIMSCVRAAQKAGPGTELKKLIAFWAEPDSKCGCGAKVATMNGWGVQGCKANFLTIVGWIYEGAIKQKPWLKYVPCRWYFRRLVKRAILNADRARIRNQSRNSSGPAERVQTADS